MRPKALVGALVLWSLLTMTRLAGAYPLHNFDCKNCHTPNVSITALGVGVNNICLQCHKPSPPMVNFGGDARGLKSADGLLTIHDASDAMGSVAAIIGSTPTSQTSHNWSASTDKFPAAGATAPSTTFYKSRYGISTNKITCSRCHEPHADLAVDKILRVGSQADICLECHGSWALANTETDYAIGTHPLVTNYEEVASGNAKYNFPMTATGELQLTDGGVACTSCHGMHWVDSNSDTPDGIANQVGLSEGDGKLLRADGRSRDSAALCQACHVYKKHGKNNLIGCLDCHSGHAYNGGSPNYYILRNTVDNIYVPKLSSTGTVTGLTYQSTDAGGVPNGQWLNLGGSGYCQGCHNLSLPHNGMSVGGRVECGQCHNHNTDSGTFSGSCNACHGYAPDQDVASGSRGYAVDPDTLASYADINPKDESTTAHKSHANKLGVGASPAADYTFDCQECHGDFLSPDPEIGTHRDGSFQDLPFNTLAKTGLSPSYAPGGNGACANIYCHSNGGKRSGDGPVRSYTPVDSGLFWQYGRTTYAISSCAACHGNDQTTMGSTERDNSASHAKHLARYASNCSLCHRETATGNTALAADAIGGKHVNGAVEVGFNVSFATASGGTYGNTNGTCAVYCHSNGGSPSSPLTYATPDWDLPASGACGTCHKASASHTGPALGGSHARHVFDTNGPQLACTECHSNGSNSPNHVNGVVNLKADLQTAVCNACHGVDSGETVPVWGNAATSTCQACHGGATLSVFGSFSATGLNAKTDFSGTGHGLAGGTYPETGRPAAGRSCTSCHDKTAAGHFDAPKGDLRLLQGGVFPASYAADKNGFCSSTQCHGPGIIKHQSKLCIACHDPHGTANIAMVYRSQALQNAKDASAGSKFSGDVVFLRFTGADSFDETDSGVGANNDDICATCHSSVNGVGHNNREVTGLHNSGDKRGTDCTLCHQHPKGFLPVGNACNDCHGNAPVTGAHGVHFQKVDDSSAEDRSDCALCHTGADLYTYDIGADQTSGVAGRQNHAQSVATRQNVLSLSVGYVSANQTCATACHKSAVADGAWDDENGMNCDACHYYAAAPTVAGNNAYPYGALGGSHNRHFAISIAPVTCGDCHGNLDSQSKGPLAHKQAKDGSTDALWLQTQGKTFLNPGGQDVNIDDSSQNAGGGNSWNATNNSCSTRMCHDPSGESRTAVWGTANDDNFCTFCHGWGASVIGTPTTGSHPQHMGMADLYGASASCQQCHPSVGVNPSHRTGRVEFTAAMGYTGEATEYSNTTWGTCGTQSCHNDGKGGAPSVSVTWGGAQAATCSLCHGAKPTSGAHNTHITATAYGPNPGGTTACNQCHRARAENTSMQSQGLHMNGKITFSDAKEITAGLINTDIAVTSCNNCHGGKASTANANSALAKANWSTAARLACGTCHGLYNLATSKADGTGIVAPNNGGTTYRDYGHGQVTISKVCADCHSNSVAHISSALGDSNRLIDISGMSYATNPNGYCEVCHNTAAFNPSTHYLNTQTAGGTSFDGNQCNICHNPHGDLDKNSTGLITMIKRTIGGKDVVGFTDETARGSYFTANPNDTNGYGICQVCHASTEVSYFNQEMANDAGHNSGPASCISCHTHNGDVAFKASCNGCHGSAVTGQYWPSGSGGSMPEANNQPGRHDAHVLVIGQRLEYGDWTATMYNDAQQKAICAYCHATPGTDADHAQSLPADTQFHPMWDVDATDTGASFSGGTCFSIDCHFNKSTDATANDYSWYGTGTSNCVMCHKDVPADTKSHTIHTSSWGITCSECHVGTPTWVNASTQSPPSTGHLDGTFLVTSTVRSFTYNSGNCGTNECHNDGNSNAPDVAGYGWAAGRTVGPCVACHYYLVDSQKHLNHLFAHDSGYEAQFVATGFDCQDCHTNQANWGGTFADHFDGEVSFLAGMNYNGNKLITDGGSYGTCTTTACHNNGQKVLATGDWVAVETPAWDRTPSAADNCGICHSAIPGGSHPAHVQGSPAIGSYIAQGLTADAGNYRYNCTACHGGTVANHINSAVDVAVANWTPVANAGDTCGQNSCHQDGTGGAPARTAVWGDAASVGSDCKGCHGNSPTTGAHDVHAVGIHVDDTYTGTAGLLAKGGTEPSSHGVAATSTVLNCNSCHNATVTAWYNATGSACSSCHSDTDQFASGNEAIAIADKRNHVNNAKDVVFQDIQFKTKAQVRNDITTVPELSGNWERVKGGFLGLFYKESDAYDRAKVSLNATTWNSGAKTCSTACHNGILTQAWSTPAGSRNGCISCHTQLP